MKFESLAMKADNLMTFLDEVIGRGPYSSDKAHTKIMRPPPKIKPENEKYKLRLKHSQQSLI